MSFTKVTSAGIGSTELVTLDSLEVINNASIGGVLTYEDVTNVDSIGIITARAGVLVGSGITLSKDGDVFFTGIATGNGSGLTALNASNLASGTVPTARLGSGTASSSTFLRGDSTFQTVDTNLVADTSPQLGGDLDTNSHNILLDDDHYVKFGDSSDLTIRHTGGANAIDAAASQYLYINSDNLRLNTKTGSEKYITGTVNGAVELYHDNTLRFLTNSLGAQCQGDFSIPLDNEQLRIGAGNDLRAYHDGSNSFLTNATGALYIAGDDIRLTNAATNEVFLGTINNGAVELYHDNSKKFETHSAGVLVSGNVYANDNNKFIAGTSNDLQIYHDGSNSYLKNAGTGNIIFLSDDVQFKSDGGGNTGLTINTDGAVELYHNNSKKLETTTTGVTAGGPNLSQTAVVGAQAGFFGGAKSSYASATGLIQNQVCILDTTTSAAAGTGGALTFAGYIDNDSTTFYATIEGVKENSSTNNYGGNLKFLTRTHSAANMKQAMLINSAGNLYIHSSDSSGSNGRIYTNGVVGGNHTTLEINNNTGSGTELITFRNSGSQIGQITQSGSGVAYGTSSDYRLKENDVAISDGITRIKQLRPIRFNFKTDTDTTLDGFFAHEVQSIVPESVKGEKDAVFTAEEAGIGSDVEGGIKSQTLDQSKLVPLLTAALQEAITKIETLETKVAALEG